MKKFAIPFLAIMLSLSVVACGGGNSASDKKEKTTQSDKKKDSGKKSKKDKKDKKEDKKDKKSKKSKKETEESESESETKGKKDKKGKSSEDFDEIVVMDNDECTIKITGIDPDSSWGFAVNTLLENHSSDKTYMFTIETSSINGLTCDALMAKDVAPGKKSNEDITFFDNSLKDAGIGDYTDIELTFSVRDYDDWGSEPMLETVHIYPYGEDKATKFEREPKSSDNIIMDNEYCTVIVTGYELDEVLGYTVQLYLVNKSDKRLTISTNNCSVNGFMLEPYFSITMPAKATALDGISWFDSDFEENDITKVDEIEFDLVVKDNDSYEQYASENIKLTPEQ